MTQDTEKERAECRKAFEFELIDNHQYVPSDFGRDGDYYADDDTQFAWELAWSSWQAARRAPAAPVPQSEPVAYLWQHCETGRTRVVMPDMVITADANWIVVGPLYLAAAPKPPGAEENLLQDQLDEALQSLVFYKRRCNLLQSIQTRMRDPERTMVCDVLANGHLLQGADGRPDKARYAPPEAAPVQLPEPVAFALEWTFNGEERGMRLYDDETHCRFDAKSDGGVCHPLYTEHQVRELLAAHGIQERST